jgi:2-polyprenyl-3-methyl-5-hydroxy-6-metoxy-1,4-benzoquinol methylase
MNSEWMWNKLAGKWDKPGVTLGENDTKIIEKAKKYLKPGSIVLDCGCATGSICMELANQVQEIQGIDISPKMIDIAKRKGAERQTQNASFRRATIFDEGLKNESFDMILVLSTLHLLKNSPQVMDRIHKLLKPGGIFISATPCLGERKSIKIPLFLLSKLGILPYVELFSVTGLADLISKANFQILENENLSRNSITEICIVAKKK